METDHVLTISTLLMKKQPLKKMFFLTWRWGLGHSLTLLILALVMFLIQSTMANLQFSFAGRLVGLSMVCLGLRVLYLELMKKSQHTHTVDTHAHNEAPVGSFLFGLGVLHGTAGSAPILLMVPIALSKSLVSVMSYVFFFSFGMILTMGVYSFILNKITWTDKLTSHLVKLRCVTAVLTVAVGIRLMGE